MLTQSQLVDATPATSSYGDAALAVGKSLYDPLSKVTFSTVAVGTTGAHGSGHVRAGHDVADGADQPCRERDRCFPHRPQLESRDRQVGVTGYKVYRGGSYLATVASTSYTDGGLTSDTPYSYYVAALDAAGNASTASNTAPLGRP